MTGDFPVFLLPPINTLGLMMAKRPMTDAPLMTKGNPWSKRTPSPICVLYGTETFMRLQKRLKITPPPTTFLTDPE